MAQTHPQIRKRKASILKVLLRTPRPRKSGSSDEKRWSRNFRALDRGDQEHVMSIWEARARAHVGGVLVTSPTVASSLDTAKLEAQALRARRMALQSPSWLRECALLHAQTAARRLRDAQQFLEHIGEPMGGLGDARRITLDVVDEIDVIDELG